MPFNKIGTKGITDGSIATAEFADGIVTSAKLQNSAVTNDKLTNTTVSVSGTSITLGSSVTFNNKFVDWQSVIVADGSTGTTGVSGRGYFINTTSAAHTFTLPISATRGDNISIKDYAGTFATNNLTIARNGHNIQGVANNSLISTNRASVVLVYVDVTRGWEFVEESNVADLQEALFITATGGTITTSGNFKIHTFTGDGSFVVSTVGNSPVVPTGGPGNVDYLVVAGGGGGGPGSRGGGGGAGGFREGRVLPAPESYTASPLVAPGGLPVSATSYPITVGGGGVDGDPGPATAGSPSVFSTITSTGGGRGTNCSPSTPPTGAAGGSGGGGCGRFSNAGGTGNSPPTSPSQGNNGGTSTGANNAPDGYAGAGGGGATAAGSANPSGSVAGNGGAGATTSISASPTAYAGGGGGGAGSSTNNQGTGGTGGSGGGGPGGGGAGGAPTKNGTAGTPNSGGGGGGGGYVTGSSGESGAGGSGIVVIRYKFQ